MLLYSTMLPTNSSMGKDEFVHLIEEWNETHSYIENKIPDLNLSGETNRRFGSENLWLRILDHHDKGILAVRYEKRFGGAIWDTDYVFDYVNCRVAIQLSRSYLELQIDADQQYSTPHFITLLIDKGFVTPDIDLPVGREAIVLSESHQDAIKKVICGQTPYSYPIVFISKTHDNTDPVDVKKMAGLLKGLAHVVVEKDISQCFALRSLCDGKEEYWGDIGIYFPDNIGHQRYHYAAESTYDQLLFDNVRRSVCQYANLQALNPLYTWPGLHGDALREKAEKYRHDIEEAMALKGKAQCELQEYLDSFDSNEHELKMLKEDNKRLRAECQIMKIRSDSAETLYRENSRLNAQLAKSQEYSQYPETPLAVAHYFESKFGDKIGFTDRALKTLEECNTSPGLLWNCFFEMATTLRDLYMNGSGDIFRVFSSMTQFEASRGEGSTTRSDVGLMRLRVDRYNGEEINCEPHVKKGTKDKDPNSVRVYYAYSEAQKLIVVSFCNGCHLDNATSRHVK